MKVDQDYFVKTVKSIAGARSIEAGPCSNDFAAWMREHHLPLQIIGLFEACSPKSDLWAGSGTLFDENAITRWNNDFPEALRALLLIVGSAPNGDHICVDLETGKVGYMSHEQEWQKEPRSYFIPISSSLGAFIRDINSDDARLPEDYWEAKRSLCS